MMLPLSKPIMINQNSILPDAQNSIEPIETKILVEFKRGKSNV